MSFDKELSLRSGNQCELCAATHNLNSHPVAPRLGTNPDECAYLCATCSEQIDGKQTVESNHWRCLNDSMWSEVPAVKVLAYRMLHQLRNDGWPGELLEMMYLEDATLTWAKEGLVDEDAPKHRDSNGVQLENGDSVVLIKDLNVKGANFTAKRGTAVRNIRLVHDNPEQIEGKINGQSIVILTQYVKK